MIGRFANRSRPRHQGVFAFLDRARRRERGFKAAILSATLLIVGGMVAGTMTGRYSALVVFNRIRWTAGALVGLEPPEEQVRAERQQRRWLDIERVRVELARTQARDARTRKLLEGTRMDADSAVIRWGNYDRTLVLSSEIFAPDDQGRSYRFRPNTRSIWIVGLSIREALGLFQVPETREAIAACRQAGGRVVPGSLHTTNSWGCRGAEPDTSADLRVLVVGDSVMQGALVGDDEAPPACLQRELAQRTGRSVSVLNAGVLGYSPEQYYYTLLEYFDRMAPQFVVVGLCDNDFGDMTNPENWDESCSWLERIAQFCRTRGVDFLVVPYVPETALLGTRDASLYPGQVSHRLLFGGTHYLYPIEEFTTEQLRLILQAQRREQPGMPSPLYNGKWMGDTHLSPLGSALWGRLVGERITLILKRQGRLRSRGPK